MMFFQQPITPFIKDNDGQVDKGCADKGWPSGGLGPDDPLDGFITGFHEA